jgi:uncharacterized protein (DUF302 family)
MIIEISPMFKDVGHSRITSMRLIAIWMVSLCWFGQLAVADSRVLVWNIDKDLETTYTTVYKALEKNKFFVVFEPNIQRNLSGFAERWGNNYNRNKLEGIRAMVFCNVWYTNEISNADPDMLAMCPLHLTLIQQAGSTRVLFVRPTIVAAGSNALAIAKELEQDISKAMDEAINELRGCPEAC